MSDEFDEIVDNIREPSVWIRILFMVAFAVASYFILLPLILVLSIAQALFTLFTGQGNANLRYFSATLTLYVIQVIEFLTYLSDVKPYPFSDLPEVEDDSLLKDSAPKNTTKKANSAGANKEKRKEDEKEKEADKESAKPAAKSAAQKKPAAVKKKAVKSKSTKKKPAKKKTAKKTPDTEKPATNEGSSS